MPNFTGHQNKRLLKITWIIVGAVILFIALLPSVPEPPKTRAERISELFSPIDGTLPDMVAMVKEKVIDPHTIQLGETTYIDQAPNIIRVQMLFHARNMFGAYLPYLAVGTIDSTGKVLTFEIEEGGRP